MNTDLNSIDAVVFNTNLKPLTSGELNNHNGGGVILETIWWLVGAWSVHSDRIQMSPSERSSFIREHGLRD